ncbi:uncharacterized protein LOC107648405 [Arachis ipaensis]|uniref:uncharacterized protein LOC107648405 n=1 Tax=Arachis ipaensis TaxID=130454 RepID=UPI000A2B134F|nr:uncharacterized protein LOC107648405 [Arachis ipaensis]
MAVAVELTSKRKEFAGERGRCCAAVRCCSATATPCRRRSFHRGFSPPRGSLVYVAASVAGLIIELWITVLVVAGLPFEKGIIDAEIVVVLALRELMSPLLLLVLNPITLILSYVCF